MGNNSRRIGIPVSIFFLLYLILVLQNDNIQHVSAVNIASFGAIVLISALGVFADPFSYSLNKFFWIFNLVFLGYIPTMQYLNGQYPWIGAKLGDDIVLKVNVIIVVCMLIYWFFFKLFWGKALSGKQDHAYTTVSLPKYYWLGTGLFFFFCLLIVVRAGGLLFLRSDVSAAGVDTAANVTENLLVDKIARSYVLMYAIVTIQLFQFKAINRFWLIVILLSTVLTNFPLALPRYLAATFYLGLLLTYKRNFRSKNFIPVTIIASLFFVFPILTEARNSYFGVDYVMNNFSRISAKAYSTGDFDAYTMFCKTVEYTDKSGVTNGGQLSGVLLFFVPRSYWPEKPFGSGYFVGEKNGFYFLNVSCPYLAEGYINAGVPGSIAIVLLFAYLFSRLDKFYWRNVLTPRGKQVNFWILIYPSLLGMFFFMMRGDLLSSYAYTFGLVITAYGTFMLIKKRLERKKALGGNFSTVRRLSLEYPLHSN